MLSRPLVPAMFATIAGILINHYMLANYKFSVFLFPIIIIIGIGVAFVIPSHFRIYWFILVFLLLGINFSHTKSTLSELSQITEIGREIVIEGTIYEQPKVIGNVATVNTRVKKIFYENSYDQVNINVLLKIYQYKGDLITGERIRFPAVLKEFKNFNNPGGFNYRSYMQGQGFSFMALTTDGRYVVPMGKGNLGIIEKSTEWVRKRIRKIFTENLTPSSLPVYSALILGERQGLAFEIREPFDRSGVGHIMAVSGLHLGLVAWLFFNSLRLLLSFSYRLTLVGDIRKIAAIVTTLPVVAYGLITGLHISSQRSMIMVLVFLWSFIIEKERDVWSSLSLAAIIVLSLNGDALFSASFQLSFIAVAGILWLAPLIFSNASQFKGINDYFEDRRILYLIFRYILGMVSVTIAATIITAPLIASYFHRFSVLAIPANLSIVPVIGFWVIPFGLLSSIVCIFSSNLAAWFLYPGESGLNLAMYLVHFWSDISWASVWVIQPNLFEIILIYIILYLIVNLRCSKVHRLLLIFFLTAFLTDSAYWIYQTRYNKDLRFTILNMAQGGAVFIQFPGKERMFVASGVFGYRGLNQGRLIIRPFLLNKKVKKLDYLFLMNRHPYHIHKLQEITDSFHPAKIISDYSTDKSIGGVVVRSFHAKHIEMTYRGWCLLFNGYKVEIKKDIVGDGEECLKLLSFTSKKLTDNPPPSTFSLKHTGAVTVVIDQKGDIKVETFLKKKLM